MLTRLSTRIQLKQELAPDLYHLQFELPQGTKIEFGAGQFMSITVAGGQRRSFSIANPPSQGGSLETYADVSPHGPAWEYFSHAQVGETVDMIVPLGHFIYEPSDLPVVFVSTGSGVVPFLSMIAHELETGGDSARQVTLIAGHRSAERAIGHAKLERLAEEHSRFSYFPLLSSGEVPRGGSFGTGRVDTLLADPIMAEADYYLCGGKEMIAGTAEILLDRGVAEQNIFFERFY